MEIIRKILEGSSTSDAVDYDAQLLTKLRDFYSSCLDEKNLDEIGSAPLVHLVNIVRELYNGSSTDISSQLKLDDPKKDSLTAAVAFLHSRGALIILLRGLVLILLHIVGIGALFGFEIEGDVGVDPNHMVPWFNQPSLGLPSKVCLLRDSFCKF